MKNDIHKTESDLFKILERKANLLDVQDALTHKADLRDIQAMPQRSEFQDVLYKVDSILAGLNSKLD